MSEADQERGSKNFSLRLSLNDQARLQRLAQRLEVDRTGALRLLIRQTTAALVTEGQFTVVRRGRARCNFPIRLMHRTSAS